MLTKRIWAPKKPKELAIGYKLLKIIADGLYAVFHRFEAFLKKG